MTHVFRARDLLGSSLTPSAHAWLSERCYATAFAALQAGDQRTALQFFCALLVLAPDDTRGLLGLAACSERRGLDVAARGLFELAATLFADRERTLQ